MTIWYRIDTGVAIMPADAMIKVQNFVYMMQSQALDILKTGASVFLTGEPGSGKTHTVNAYVYWLRAHNIEVAITASTGIAATHIGGMTIHSWSGIGIKSELTKRDLDKIAGADYITRRMKSARVLIIDEVSMLAPDTLDMVDTVCRYVRGSTAAFGGLQVVLVGDFFQLPAIIKREMEISQQTKLLDMPKGRFAYSARVWTQSALQVCYLTEQYRQDDADFLALLSAIRTNTFDEIHLHHLEKRKIQIQQAPVGTPKLFAHNANVDEVNSQMLDKLPGEVSSFRMRSVGPKALIAGLQKGCLSPEILDLKRNASVMFTKNNPRLGFVNGTLGTVVDFDSDTKMPIVMTRRGDYIHVEPMEWQVEENGRASAGITQIPLRLAWAITVHKSQGMSLDEAVMDLSRVFEYGQGYVALSRVRRLSGLHILGWNERAFQVHPEVFVADELFRSASAQNEQTFRELSPADMTSKQEDFIIRSGGTLGAVRKKKEKKPKKIDSTIQTLELWKQGMTLVEIATHRELKEETILNHLEKLKTQGTIDIKELSRIITPLLLEALPKIHAVFRKLDTDKLSPVFQKMNGSFSYADLRIARLVFDT